MILPVRMLAFMTENDVRPVTIPDSYGHTVSDGLAAVFYHGQNESCLAADYHLRSKYCSVSMGDVIEWEGFGNFLVASLGFYKLADVEYAEYKNLPRRDDRGTMDRILWVMKKRSNVQ